MFFPSHFLILFHSRRNFGIFCILALFSSQIFLRLGSKIQKGLPMCPVFVVYYPISQRFHHNFVLCYRQTINLLKRCESQIPEAADCSFPVLFFEARLFMSYIAYFFAFSSSIVFSRFWTHFFVAFALFKKPIVSSKS